MSRVDAKYRLWIAVSSALLIALTSCLVVSRARVRTDFSSVPKNLLPFYQESQKCKLVSDTKVDIWPGHIVHMYRHACDTGFISRLPIDVQREITAKSAFPDGAEALLFIEQKRLSRKVLFVTFSNGQFEHVTYAKIDGQPAVLAEEEAQGASGGWHEWSLISILPKGEIGAVSLSRPEPLERAIPPGMTVGSPSPTLESGAMFLNGPLYKKSDAMCCPTGGVMLSRLSLVNGQLSVKYSKRTTDDGARKLIAAAVQPPRPPPSSTLSAPRLTSVGMFSDPPIRISIGVPCPDSDKPDLAGTSQRLDGTRIRSCDYVFLFNEFRGNTLRVTPFLYRGAHPPASLHELCQLRYSGEELLTSGGASFNIDFALNNASKMPIMLSVEEVSAETKQSFVTDQSKLAILLSANDVRYYDKAQAAKHVWH